MNDNDRRYGETSEGRDDVFDDDAFDDESFEESDRDSDFAAIYTEVEEELDVGELSGFELPREEESPDADAGTAAAADESRWEYFEEEQAGDDEFEDEFDDDLELPPEDDLFPAAADADTPASLALDDDEDEDEDWEDSDDEDDRFAEEPREYREISIPFGMIAVAVVALLLLGIGGYGVIKQRAENREEIRQLQARLATAAAPAEVTASRDAARAAQEKNRDLEAQVERLTHENENLQAIVNGLETQLAAQQEALQKNPPPAPTKTVVSKPAASKPQAAAPATAGDISATGWFVNFSSYTRRDSAEAWVSKLHPEKGRVIVATGESGGKSVYRVRVVDLPDKATAEAVARQLEQQYQLSRLWVGKLP